MKRKPVKRKKWLLAVTAVIVVCAIGAGIFLGVRGGGEPVNVYAFQYVGMTEFWGDSQESYGPVTTDKIQTVFLSDTQTVTEIVAKAGDTVKKGDILLSFDTTLDDLALERKRLDVEKIKLELKAAETDLEKVQKMKPMEIPEETEPEVTEPNLGDPMPTESYYVISEDKGFDGSTMEKSLILWLRDGESLNNGLLRIMQQKAQEYQEYNKNKPESSASALPDGEDGSAAPLNESEEGGGDTGGDNDGGTDGDIGGGSGGDNSDGSDGNNDGGTDGDNAGGSDGNNSNGSDDNNGGSTDGDNGDDTDGNNGDGSDGNIDGGSGSNPPVIDFLGDPPVEDSLPEKCTIEISITCDGAVAETVEVEVGSSGYILNNAYTHDNKTYWLESATVEGEALLVSKIPGFPQTTAEEQAAWKSQWDGTVTLNYMRETEIQCFTDMTENTVTLESEKDAALFFTAVFENVPTGGRWKWTVTPETGILQPSATENFLILSGTPAEKTDSPVSYTVSAMYEFTDRTGQSRAVKAEFPFNLTVTENSADITLGEYYMILKVTEGDMERGIPLIWQGIHVYAYADGSFGFTLFDASMVTDHMLEPLEELPIEGLPTIDFGSGYTAKQLAQMRTDLQKKIKETQLNLKMAEAEYKIMERELSDGHIYADIDGEVVSVLTEEEARSSRQPVVKVSGGGGFFVEGSVSELEKDNLKLGQEVTINDWNTGMTYTGEVRSIGDFPGNDSGWNGMGNPNATYYPFTVFIDGSADLQAGSYVSVMYSTTEGGNGIYLTNAFLRTEQGRSYVMAAGTDGRLEKRYVTTGKSLWGSYTEILSGLSEEEFLAFPYGKEVKEGAPTVESDISALYSY